MHGSSVVPMVEKFIPSLGVVLNSKYIIITCRPYLSLMSNVPSKPSILKKAFDSHIVCLVLLASHLLLLNVRSFLSTQMAHVVILLSRSQMLESLLRALGIFFSKIPCCPSSGFQGFFCPDLGLLTMPVEKSQAPWATP